MARQRSEERYARESSTGEILQSTTTMVSIAAAFLAFLLETKPAFMIPLFVSVYVSGALALIASAFSLVELLNERPGGRWYHLILPISSIGLLFFVILSFGVAYFILFLQFRN